MKMKPEHYKHLETEIKKVMEAYPNLKNAYEKDGLSGKRFRWDILYAAKLSTWISDNLYSYLNDDHIDTALKKITSTK